MLSKAREIICDWLENVLDYEEREDLLTDIHFNTVKEFGEILYVVNRYLGHNNFNGEFDGVAMELEELYN